MGRTLSPVFALKFEICPPGISGMDGILSWTTVDRANILEQLFSPEKQTWKGSDIMVEADLC
jgi:hypothetical protein